MKSDTKIVIAVLGLTVLIVVFIVATSPKAVEADPAVVNGSGQATGSAQAKVVLTEFSDFFCPACKEAEPYVERIVGNHSSEVKFIYRHFPLPQHSLAFRASQAAESAALQGKFWEYKKEIFANQENLKEPSFEEIAMKLGLNMERFRADLDSIETLKRVQGDMTDAKALNLNSTPTFFINGTKLNLSSFASLDKEIESRL